MVALITEQDETSRRTWYTLLFFIFQTKNFDQDKKVNWRNDRWLCADPSDVPHAMYNKFSTSLMVFSYLIHQT